MITDDTYTYNDLIRNSGYNKHHSIPSNELCQETFCVIKYLIEQKHLYCTCLHLSCFWFYNFLTMKFQPKFLK